MAIVEGSGKNSRSITVAERLLHHFQETTFVIMIGFMKWRSHQVWQNDDWRSQSHAIV